MQPLELVIREGTIKAALPPDVPPVFDEHPVNAARRDAVRMNHGIRLWHRVQRRRWVGAVIGGKFYAVDWRA